ncbi:hypothetical protein M758_UG006000 [Ceratodon purpureus]|nr:hypothetical protein M758_UG006000 [Ceratodon purpureus]
MLQLPPRLAVPQYHNAESFSRELRASHLLAGFFVPCLTASSQGHQHQSKQSNRVLVQYGSSKSLPPRAPSSPSLAERRKRQGLVGRCYSTPKEGCQIRVSKSTANSPFLQALSRNLFSEETENSNSPGSWLQKNSSKPKAALSSPRSILFGPDESSSSQASASKVFSSGDLKDFTPQINHSGQSASKSSKSSFESIEEAFAELPSPAAPDSTIW